MNKKLYELMNWPEIEGIVYSDSDSPKDLLGGHIVKGGFLIQVFRPDAVSVSVVVEGKKTAIELEKVDESGFFACLIPGKKKLDYTVTIETVKGEKKTFVDPYAIANVTREENYKAFLAGSEKELLKVLGSRECEIAKVKGTLFSVYAPHALRVSVIGAFNNWDGRIHQMEKIGSSGVFELFIPGILKGEEYLYEVKVHGSLIKQKLDPCARVITNGADMHSVVASEERYGWSDSSWIDDRRKEAAKKSKSKKPVLLYEVSLAMWSKISGKKTYKTLAKDIASYVKSQGYTHVVLMPVAEYMDDNQFGYTTVGYFAPTSRYGSNAGFKEMIDIFHNEKIGVILDWNGAYFGMDGLGLADFDGQNLYGYLKPRLVKNPDRNVYTFDYSKGTVRSFLLSNISMWLDEYHIDGIRVDGVSSMLYLDYGKEPGTWYPNIYGGNENLDAVNFIKEMHSMIQKRKDSVITIAEESSLWAGVTKANDGESLGFDYKINNGWKNDFFEFIEKDPLFRKGDYNRLSNSMLYNYGEDYIIGSSHDDFVNASMLSKMSGQELKDRLADFRAGMGYMYAHPGVKLSFMGQDIGLDKNVSISEGYFEQIEQDEYKNMKTFVSELNAFYQKNPAMFELDGFTDGFSWLDNDNAEETVLAFSRKDKKGRELTVVINFTPVERENYRLHVNEAGKYKVVFNSDLKKYGGNSNINSKFNNSDNEDFDGKNYIDITIPASSFMIFDFTPYTEYELEEIAILKKAKVAKKEADAKAYIAKQLEEEAVERAMKALEAERIANEAAKEAIKAKEEAKKKALEALEESKKIDIETKKALEELKKKAAKSK